MKRLIYILLVLCAVCGLHACSETDYPLFDDSTINIYFTADSVDYSFGIVPLSTTERIVELPVKIIGAPVAHERSFKLEVVAEKTNADADLQYSIPESLTIAADSINGVVPVTIYRSNLNEQLWKLTLRLLPNENFMPAPDVDTDMGVEAVITFNNVISKPNWKNSWTGEFAWMENYLGPWNPVVYVTFMEYFHRLEEVAPVTYQNLVDLYGENLDNGSFSGWDWNYTFTLTKYVLTPMYAYFQEHPELGVTDFPNPNN